MPDLDVVIPTRDRPAQLAATLQSLGSQSFQHFGVIVIDDGSTDPVDVPHGPEWLRIVRNEQSTGPGPSRNRGVAESAAPYVVFLDDDCIAHPELLARHHAALSRSAGPVVSLGPILSPPGRRLPAWTSWDADRLEREYARLARGAIAPEWTHLYTGNVALRRADFAAVGGFDDRFARQEDMELGFRLSRSGCRFAFDPAAVVWHDSSRSLRAWTGIPAASARYDVLMDRLVPDSKRLPSVHAAQRQRHWALRVARRLLRPPLARRSAVASAIAAGRVLHAVRADQPAMAAFSLVWDLEYDRALREAELSR